MRDAAPLPPSDSFGIRLIRAARLWRREADAALVACGLSEATVLPLMMLERLGCGARQRALAEEIGIEGPSLVRLLDTLEAGGLVERRGDATDRRAKTLHLTAAGREVLARAQDALAGVRGRLLADLGADEVGACLRAFGAIEAAAKGETGR